MLHSYEAILDHGQLSWNGPAPMPNRARVIVTVLDEFKVNTSALPLSAIAEVGQFFALHQVDLSHFTFDRDSLYGR
jgi:hypothetical protein